MAGSRQLLGVKRVVTTRHVIAVALAAALVGGSAPAAGAAFVGKRAAREYLLGAVPKGAPRVLLQDERAAFFRTARLRVEPASQCHRRKRPKRGVLCATQQHRARGTLYSKAVP